MDSGGEYNESRNDSHWLDQKHPSFTSPTLSENINLETASVCMSVTKEATRKATGRVNYSLKYWGCTNYLRYHVDRFHTNINCPQNMDPEVPERAKWSIQDYA